MIQSALARFSLVEFPVAALVLFILAWTVIVVQAWVQSPAEVERLRALPLDDGSLGEREDAR